MSQSNAQEKYLYKTLASGENIGLGVESNSVLLTVWPVKFDTFSVRHPRQ